MKDEAAPASDDPFTAMNPQLQELYKQTLLQHSKDDSRRHALPDANRQHTTRNPLCGDEITVYLKVGEAGVEALSYESQSCTICNASASMLAHAAPGATPEKLRRDAQTLIAALSEKKETSQLEGDLSALSGVLAFPSRIRCATLPWEALLAATEADKL